jgi:integrase
VKVVHGRKSISWANSVLPVFMSGSGGGCPGIFSDLHFDVQIDTNLFRTESAVIQGFQRFVFSFNRTAVKKSFYSYRAALLYGTAQEAAGALRARDKSEYLSNEWHAALKTLQRCKAVFDRYPPDPQRTHRISGSSSFTWSAIQTHKNQNMVGWSPAVNSKKRVLSALRKIDDWHGKLFSKVTAVHKSAAAICSLTGARPSEIARGVTVQITGTRDNQKLVITIRGTKLTAMTGQPERILKLGIDSPEARHLLELCNDSSPFIITTHPGNLTAAVIKAGKAAFPNLRMTVSPYVFRHSVAAELKASGISEELIAKTLGHQATKSQQAYGLSVHASGTHSINAVSAIMPIRLTHRHPQQALCMSSDVPSVRFRP